MQIKDRCRVKIESVAFGGSGVGRADGFVVFVPFTAPGDVAEIEIVELKKKFARGRVLKIIEPSSLRTEPLCRYYGRCGGCCYQHIDYAGQLIIKQQQIRDAFSKIGGLADPPVREVVASPQIYAYRGKAELHAAKISGNIRLGFMDVSGGRLVDIERCEIVHNTINDQLREIRAGDMRSLAGGDIIFWSGNSDGPDGSVTREVKSKEFWVPQDGFFQANLYLTDRMVDEVCGLLAGRGKGTILDACCGSGFFSIFLASYASRLIGVEINEKSVKYARINAERQGISNAEFICGDIEDVLGKMAQTKDRVDVILLDPPRTGLSREAQSAVSGLKAENIIYVSCNPATQARDVNMLGRYGYVLESLLPLDMFPQTEHVEIIAVLRKR